MPLDSRVGLLYFSQKLQVLTVWKESSNGVSLNRSGVARNDSAAWILCHVQYFNIGVFNLLTLFCVGVLSLYPRDRL